MLILHARDGEGVGGPPPLPDTGFVVLAGPDQAFGAAEARVVPGGPVARLLYLQPEASAFAVLADACRAFPDQLRQRLSPLHYRRTESEAASSARWHDAGAGLHLRHAQDGRVVEFRLHASAATHPLLPRLSGMLRDRAGPDLRRFAFLAAALAAA